MVIGRHKRIEMREASNNRFWDCSPLFRFALSSFIRIEIEQMSSKSKKQKHTDKQKVFLQFYNDIIVHGIFLKNDKDIFVRIWKILEYKEQQRIRSKEDSKSNCNIMKHFFRTTFCNRPHSSRHTGEIERNIFILYQYNSDQSNRNKYLSDLQDFYHALFFKK